MPRLAFALLSSALVLGVATTAGAQVADDTFRVHSTGRLTVDGGLIMGMPAALGTGLSTGVGGGVTFGGGLIAWGARASWASATESSISWTVTHADLRLRAAAAIQVAAGRGRFALRLGIGPTMIHESRVRNQGARAGLTGSDLETSAFVLLPAADVEAVVALHIAGPWLLTIGGGPSLALESGNARGGWTAQLGAGWQP
jgi:hypothetical protein